MTLYEMLREVVDKQGSDLHLQAGTPPMMRGCDGELRAMGEQTLDADEIEQLLREAMPAEEAEHIGDRDYATSWEVDGVGRVRAALYRQNRTVAAALRLVPERVPDLDTIGAPPGVRSLCELRKGLVLVTGASGSGKTTTLLSMLDHINQTRSAHILCIMDPIDYMLRSGQSMVTIREVGVDADSFSAAIRHGLQHDADVVLVSEMRDLESVSLTLAMAEMGHLVLSQLHASNASQAVGRIVDVFPESQREYVRRQMANNLGGIVGQYLLPRNDRRGRVAVNEVLLGTPQVVQMILAGAEDFTVAMEAGRDRGMQTFDQSLADHVAAGRLSREAAFQRATSRERLAELLGGAGV